MKEQIEGWLNDFPEVKWDRWSGTIEEFDVFGWIERSDRRRAYKDFLVISFKNAQPVAFSTSSSLFSERFSNRLDFTHESCKRVENSFNVINVITSKKRAKD